MTDAEKNKHFRALLAQMRAAWKANDMLTVGNVAYDIVRLADNPDDWKESWASMER